MIEFRRDHSFQGQNHFPQDIPSESENVSTDDDHASDDRASQIQPKESIEFFFLLASKGIGLLIVKPQFVFDNRDAHTQPRKKEGREFQVLYSILIVISNLGTLNHSVINEVAVFLQKINSLVLTFLNKNVYYIACVIRDSFSSNSVMIS